MSLSKAGGTSVDDLPYLKNEGESEQGSFGASAHPKEDGHIHHTLFGEVYLLPPPSPPLSLLLAHGLFLLLRLLSNCPRYLALSSSPSSFSFRGLDTNSHKPLPELDEKGKDGTGLAGLRCSERDGLGLTGLEKRVWQETRKARLHQSNQITQLCLLALVGGHDILDVGWDSESHHDFPLPTTFTLADSHRAHTWKVELDLRWYQLVNWTFESGSLVADIWKPYSVTRCSSHIPHPPMTDAFLSMIRYLHSLPKNQKQRRPKPLFDTHPKLSSSYLERTGADHEGSCLSPCLDSTLKCQDYLCKAIDQESSKVEGGDKQVPLAARARYHNDAPTSHSLAKAPTPAPTHLVLTLPSDGFSSSSLSISNKDSLYYQTKFKLVLLSSSSAAPDLAKIGSASDEVDQPVSRNHSVVTECGHSTPDELEVHVRNLWIKAQNKHERTNILFYSIRTTAPISLSTSPCLVNPRAKRRHLSKLGTVIRANGVKSPHSACPPECAAQAKRTRLKKICINPSPHGVHVAVPDPVIGRKAGICNGNSSVDTCILEILSLRNAAR
ncbi:uncharacterized protein CLUP02_10142 [Colletotrichum lupini]|uniref:Uncharacterized protein n=1 Tax=Colletotrichum lupini TaxID=145971 RepID=A0A9Q8SW51_9PEZI|nr:uncharacterized protein CLUP02_10142 [Colletotrichum lupini]UQC84646.1 hypothetical protein CLUP02_10142 [Colletotrichum lupini]